MTVLKKFLCLTLCMLSLASATAETQIFILPQGIRTLGSKALSNIAMPAGILLPESLTSIAPDAFADTLIYGVSGGRAEAYAAARGLDFRSIDISGITIDAPDCVSPCRPFTVRAEALSVLPYTVRFSVYKNGELCYESSPADDGTGEIVLYEAGLYDYTVTLFNDYTSARATFERKTEVCEPVRLVKNRWFVRLGESFCPVDEAETRAVELLAGSAFTVAGSTMTAKQLGSFLVTARAMQNGKEVYTDFEVNVAVPVDTLRTEPADVSLYIGESCQPQIEVLPDTAEGYEMTWESSNPSVASVDEYGRIAAIAQGEAVISVSTFDAQAKISVHVMQAAESIHILEPAGGTAIPQYGRIRLDYKILPQNADNISVKWISSNERILSVDAAGYVRALSPGSARICVLNEADPALKDEITLTVTEGTHAVTADVPEWMYTGETHILAVKTQPVDAAGSVSISVSDENVASVSGAVLQALAPGETVLTFKSADGISKSYTLRVYDRCTSISGHLSELYLNKGMNARMSDLIQFAPDGCKVESLQYSSSDSSVVTVDDAGLIRASGTGSAIVSVTAGRLRYELTVHVVSDGKVISTAAVSPAYLVLVCGESGTISPVISAADGKYKDGKWYSDDESVVSIESIGSGASVTVRAQRPGTAHITMITSSGQSASCEVIVNPVALKSISSTMKSCTMKPGEACQFEYTLNPANGDTSEMVACSSDASVAEISSDGTITAVGAGECEVFLIAGDIAVSCAVTVSALDMTEAWLCESEYRGMAGESALICYAFNPENASPAAFIWTSRNMAIAEVDAQSGLIFFRAAGETDIVGEAADHSGLSLRARVIVDEVPVKMLTLSQEDFTLDAGDSAEILYSVYPHNASCSEAVFESADENVARVDERGRITAVRSGSTDIFVTVGRGSYEITRMVSVTVKRTTNVQYRAFIMGQFTVPGAKGYLPFSLNSTRAVYDALSLSTLDAAGYSIKCMPASPTIASVRAGLKSIAGQTDEDDVTVIYLLTHGSYNTNTGYYLQFSNGKEYYAAAILRDVEQISGHVLLVLDSCYSGRMLVSSEMSKLKSNGGVYQGLNGLGHLSVICGSTDTRSTYYDVSSPTEAYDFFTKAFAQGLGWNMLSDTRMVVMADTNSDGKVTVSELYSFVRPQTQKLISAYVQLNGTRNFVGNPNQYPSCYIAPGEENLVIWGK